jgi:hypothetical protein
VQFFQVQGIFSLLLQEFVGIRRRDIKNGMGCQAKKRKRRQDQDDMGEKPAREGSGLIQPMSFMPSMSAGWI